MKHEEKLKYMALASRICGFNFHPQDLDLIVSLYEHISQYGGDTDLRSLAKIKMDIEEKYNEPKSIP